MGWFLFKTEPSTFSYADLARDKHAVWDGVSNPVALKNLRTVAKGDQVFIYHTGAEKAVVGIAIATSAPYPDPKLDDEKRIVIDLKPSRELAKPVPLSTFRTDPELRAHDIVRLPRLSVMPLTKSQFERVLELSGD